MYRQTEQLLPTFYSPEIFPHSSKSLQLENHLILVFSITCDQSKKRV